MKMATLAGKPITQNGLGLAGMFFILLLELDANNIDKIKDLQTGWLQHRMILPSES
jgi:hypothetical protein